jgi:hypothetical protein
MLVPNTVRECVCFAYIQYRGKLRPVGTAFFLGIPMGETGRFGCVVVTAMHVVAKARECADDGCVRLRVNTTAGGFEIVPIADDQWSIPDQSDRAVDVAASVWPHGRERFDFRFPTVDDAVTSTVLESQVVGAGDEVFLPGLFINHHGTQRNIPIVRVGNIAAMPDEPVRTRMLGSIDAYLVEARSVGGLSGSPVFLNLGIVRPRSQEPGADLRLHTGQRTWYLLGIMHGHWEAEREDVTIDAVAGAEYVNMGIAVVTPIREVLVLLQAEPLKPTFAKMLRRTEEALASGSLPPLATSHPDT